MKHLPRPIAILVASILFLSGALSSCSKKDEANNGTDKAKHSTAIETKKDPYEEFLAKLTENSLGGMLPSGTFGFVMFMNQNGIAKQQKDYWEKDLPKEVRDIVQQSMAGLEKILDEAGVLEGKSIDDVYEMESVQFVTHLKEESKESIDVNSDNKTTNAKQVEEKTGAGFIARFKLERLQDKAKDIAASLSRSGYPAAVIEKAGTADSLSKAKEYALIEFSQDSSFLSGFRYLALMNEFVAFSSAPEVLGEIFSAEVKGLPAVFRDAEFKKTAERLSFMDSAVVFGGIKGDPKMLQDSLGHSSSAAQGDTQLMNSPLGALLNTSSPSDSIAPEKPLILAFNQSFDSQYRAELRAPLSKDMSQWLNSVGPETSDQTVKVKENIEPLVSIPGSSIPGNGILYLEFSPKSTRHMAANVIPLFVNFNDIDIAELLKSITQFSVVLSATEGQQSFLPFPSIGFQFHFSDLEKALPMFEKLIEKQFQASGLVPPGATWMPDGEKAKSMLTAIGEQVVLMSQKGEGQSGTLALSSSRDQAKYLLNGVSENKGPILKFSDFMPNKDSSFGPASTDQQITDLVLLFLNFKALNNALEKVFTMSAVFGQDPMKNTGGFDPQNLGKALAAIGASGIRLYVEDISENEETPSHEFVVKAQAKKID